ncbi:MAG: FtsX-like permease family protein, partial [Acidobacteria bacterium]
MEVTVNTTFLRDMRYGIRVLRRSPSFSVVAILTLALGIGATTAIFSVLDAVMLRPLPYPEPHRIISIGTRATDTGRDSARVTGGDLLEMRANAKPFAALAWYWGGEVGAQVGGAGQFAGVCWVEPALFEVFGVTAVAGRTFGAADGEGAAVIGHGLAERLFGSAGRALGKPVSVEGQAYEIVGVLPRGFDAPRKTDLWLPAPPLPSIARNRTAFNFFAVARLADGVTVAGARASLEALAAHLAGAFPETNGSRSFTVTPLASRVAAPARATLLVLMGAVALVLLIACVNVASLLLARAAGRSHEIALRAALGAGRWRLVRQLAAESLVLAAAGGALGVALAWAGTGALVRLAPGGLPRLDEVAVNWRILAFAGACSLLASLVFGLVPAWHAARAGVNEGLKQASPRGLLGGGSATLRNALVAGEIALAFSLAVGAGLLLRSFVQLTGRDLGYRPESVLVAQTHRPASGLAEYVEVARFFNEIEPRLAGIPGVTAVGAAMGLPAGQYGSNGAYAVEGKHVFTEGQKLPEAGFRLASPGYFGALGVPLLRGRDFGVADTYD